MNVCLCFCLASGVFKVYVVRSGRWSELSSWSADHELWRAMFGERSVMSGDVGCVFVLKGLRVGVCGSFMIM